MIPAPDTWGQGWFLTMISSLMCALGAAVIFLDNIYYAIFPECIVSRFRFKLQLNYSFLNGSLAFSSGCLLYISLYRLLPEALDYFMKASSSGPTRSNSDDDLRLNQKQWANAQLLAAYALGIGLCISLNAFLHMVTSELVVHCSHDGEDRSPDNVDHHHEDHHDSSPKDHGHPHDHTDLESGSKDYFSNHHYQHDTTNARESMHSHEQLQDYSCVISDPAGLKVPNVAAMLDPRAPLLGNARRLKSFIHYIVPHNDGNGSCNNNVGECKGLSLAEVCRYRTVNESGTHLLHFCEIPQLRPGSASIEEENDPDCHATSQIRRQSNLHQHTRPLNHLTHLDDHHHHVNTPTSRLLLIGVQTTVAITLHKLPEGFVTYVTSTTSPKLGFSIFLSLLLHNFTEGFSMCMPLYYSFAQSQNGKRLAKLKAFLISAILGGFSQPLGALLGYVFLRVNHYSDGPSNPPLKIDLARLDLVFGACMAVTAGFLTVVGLSMYGLAVQFGGSLQFVLTWCVIGMCLIGFSTVLV